ncbi:hypothetical protein OC861_006443 [Tilletia horrida]|nr:hypothetical protein OC861_006443 [Tilletia horrida]
MTAGFEQATSSRTRSRQAPDKQDPNPLEFELMSGYGKKKVHVVNPPLSLLGKNYHRTLAATEPQGNRDRRQPMQ